MKAKAFVDCGDIIGRISPFIYGQFLEHLNSVIYGGVWVGEDSSIPNVRGFRKDVLEAVKAVRAPIVRYPGGNFASQYHFEDGIGPRARRPTRWDLAWKVEEPNHFGTDEFIEWCRLTGSAPYLCVNAGNGTPEEAARWVEYCNRDGATHYAKLRRANGHAQPHNVKHWAIGNELYGEWQIGHCADGLECAKRTIAFAHSMRQVDPQIELIGVGTRHLPQWNWDMITTAGKWLNHLSVHCYIHLSKHSLNDLLGCSAYFSQILDHVAATIKGARTAARIEHPISIALDEWNLWYHDVNSDHDPDGSGQKVTALKDGLATACIFNVFHRHCQNLSMANLAQTVNALPLIYTRQDGTGSMFCNPQYLAFKLYANHTGELCVRNRVETDGYHTHATSFFGEVCKAEVPYLDLSTTFSPDRRTLYLHAVNRHATDAVECEFELRGAQPELGTAFVLTGVNPESRNTFEQPHAVALAESRGHKAGAKFTHSFPPLSATVLELH